MFALHVLWLCNGTLFYFQIITLWKYRKICASIFWVSFESKYKHQPRSTRIILKICFTCSNNATETQYTFCFWKCLIERFYFFHLIVHQNSHPAGVPKKLFSQRMGSSPSCPIQILGWGRSLFQGRSTGRWYACLEEGTPAGLHFHEILRPTH